MYKGKLTYIRFGPHTVFILIVFNFVYSHVKKFFFFRKKCTQSVYYTLTQDTAVLFPAHTYLSRLIDSPAICLVAIMLLANAIIIFVVILATVNKLVHAVL